MALDWSECSGVESDPEKMSGAWVFRGTRFPISTVFENLEQGATIDDILEWYQGLTDSKSRRWWPSLPRAHKLNRCAREC